MGLSNNLISPFWGAICSGIRSVLLAFILYSPLYIKPIISGHHAVFAIAHIIADFPAGVPRGKTGGIKTQVMKTGVF
jgi:hypothetical protein